MNSLKFDNTLDFDCDLIVTIWQQIAVAPQLLSLKELLDFELKQKDSKERISAALDIRKIAHEIKNIVMTNILDSLPKDIFRDLDERVRQCSRPAAGRTRTRDSCRS